MKIQHLFCLLTMLFIVFLVGCSKEDEPELPQCPSNLSISSRQDIIDFQNNYPDCTDLTDLTSYLDGKLIIENSDALTSLIGLENLTTVRYLYIENNTALTSLSGLDNLTTVGDGLHIKNNDALTSLSGLGNLTKVGSLYIKKYISEYLTPTFRTV
jgi:hypothetical protein